MKNILLKKRNEPRKENEGKFEELLKLKVGTNIFLRNKNLLIIINQSLFINLHLQLRGLMTD